MSSKRHLILGLVFIFCLVGCVTPPKPASCKGAFKPVNEGQQHSQMNQFNLVQIDSVQTEITYFS